MNIALFSPSKNPYSETFIQAHKNRLEGKVFYYYGLGDDMRLEGSSKPINKRLGLANIWNKLLGKTYEQRKWQGLMASMETNQIDVILVEYGNHAFDLLGFLKKAALPFVVHFHGYDASATRTIQLCDSYKGVFEYASKVIAVSRKMSQMLLEIGCPESKLVYNVYGPNPIFEAVAPSFSKPQFVAVGRFTDKKAPYYLILCFRKVVEQFPEARLIIAGNGALWNTCENLIKHYGLERNLELPGVITPAEYQSLLMESQAFVQHSVTASNGDMEGTPLSILEASVAGLPVIATYHAGIPDVIVDGKTGMLVQEHDVEGMGDAMLKILGDQELARQMGAAAKNHILENFSMKRHISELNRILREAQSNPRT